MSFQFSAPSDGTVSVTGYDGSPPVNLEIPATDGLGNTVVAIGANAFENQPGITSLTFPVNSSLTSIGNGAFSGCTRLATLTFPTSLTSIASTAFSNCTGLTALTFPANLNSIGFDAFSDCTGLTSVTFLGSPPNFDRDVFSPTGVTSINAPCYQGWSDVLVISSTASPPSLSYPVILFGCNNNPTQQRMFQAVRPRSSSEFLALRRLQIQQSLNTVPSNNYQDSSEQTARFRKGASAFTYRHGDSATMVKFKASSVVQAQREGSAYCCAVSNYVRPENRTSPGCDRMLIDQVTFPKAIDCAYPVPNAAPQVVPFNPTVELPLRRNDNKVVISRSSVNTAGCGVNQ